MTFKDVAFRSCYRLWHQTAMIKRVKARRLQLIFDLINFTPAAGVRLLDVGCADGKDVISHLRGTPTELYGLDIDDYRIEQENFTFIHADAAKIPYPDKYFDATISVGVLEHIEPMAKLAAVSSEIARVSKSWAVVMPSIATILEPHTLSLFWQLRRNGGRKLPMTNLNFFSDEAWLQFDGFVGARAKRFYYLPPIISNIVIYQPKAG